MSKWSVHPEMKKQVVHRSKYLRVSDHQLRAYEKVCYKDTVFHKLEG